MKCGRVSCVKFKSIDCGHDVEPNQKCEHYVNNGDPVPDVQQDKKPEKVKP